MSQILEFQGVFIALTYKLR